MVIELIQLLLILLLPLEIQKEIVASIEEEQKLIDVNKQLIEIFKKKVKDKIVEVWERMNEIQRKDNDFLKGTLTWSNGPSPGTTKCRTKLLILKNKYKLNWKEFSNNKKYLFKYVLIKV